jgi:PH domain
LRKIVLDVDKSLLTYYQGHMKKGSMSLRGATVKRLSFEEAEQRQFAFEIVALLTPGEEDRGNQLILSASSEAEADDWVDSIRSAISWAALAGMKAAPGCDHVYESLFDLAAVIKTEDLDASYYRNLRAKKAKAKADEEAGVAECAGEGIGTLP